MEISILREISSVACSIVVEARDQKYDNVLKNAIQIVEMCETESIMSRKRMRTGVEDGGASRERGADFEAGSPSTDEMQEREEREKVTLIEESDKAGTFIIPFGKHRGTRVDKAPKDYLCWLMGMKCEKGKYSPIATDTLNWVRANQHETLSHIKKYLTWRCWECSSHDIRFKYAHLCTHCWFQSRK